ncbi:peptide deformylase [Buchnera aphidicola]|uniref:peptide deformylase n=1 Tax=Buchnera aphidicola TaxID=9 RepID=UPI0034641639
MKILLYPDKKLRKKAKPVQKINEKIKIIINNMFKTMLYNEGIGLAATQVDIHLQIIVIGKINNLCNPFALINPKIIKKSGYTSIEEGCLSIPKKKFFVPRYKKIKVKGINEKGKKIIFTAESLLSICIQHEIDHLIGKLILDYL